MSSIVGGVAKGSLKFGRTLRLLYPCSISNTSQHVNDKKISSSSKAMKILSESTTIVQDGISIGELPILIRRATKDTYPFTSHTYCGENMRAETEFDSSFKDMLANCDSVSDVFNLLEVPSDKVQGHSAVYALQRLHVLMSLNTDWKQIHSFIRRAVIGELYHIVERDIRHLSNFSLVTLVDCYFAAEGFSVSCSEVVSDEISHRLVEGLFSVEELLSLVQSLKSGIRNSKNKLSRKDSDMNFDEKKPSSFEEVLSENASVFLSTGSSDSTDESSKSSSNIAGVEMEHQKYRELLQNVWVHLASRCNDMDENTIPWTMQLLPSNKRILIPLLDKKLTHVWPMLSAETAGMCLDNLVRLRTHSSSMMTKLGRYAFLNIHLMTPSVLLSYLQAFLHFSVLDSNLIIVIQKCISKTGIDTPKDLLALCVEYLRSCRYVSPIIMDVAADHFAQHWESYSPLEIFAVLRSFGQLNYLPSKPQNFLFKVETCLDKRFDVMDEAQLLEVLASFTFVTTLSRNFYKRITSDYFFKKIGALKNISKTSALMWMKIMKHAMVMGSQETCTDSHKRWILKGTKKWSIFLFQDNDKVAVYSLKSALNNLFGPELYHLIPFYSCFAIYLDERGIPVRISSEEKGFPQPVVPPAQSLVILLRSGRHLNSNTGQLMGSQQQRLDHLKKLGYTPVEIRASNFMTQASSKVLRSHLANFVDFDNPEVTAFEQRHFKDLEEKYLKDWMEDDCETEDEDVVENVMALGDLMDDVSMEIAKNSGNGSSLSSSSTDKDED